MKYRNAMDTRENMKYALVTGAASGMGRMYAWELAARGYGLFLADINADGLAALSAELVSAGYPAPVLYPCNLCEEDIASRMAAFADERGLEVTVLVNNAGMLVTTPICDTDPARLRAIMMLHCQTPLMLCREFAPRMKNGGHILNICSICAWMAWPLIGMYGNTKRFVKGYSRSLRIELKDSGISVTTAYFGAVDTPLFAFPPRLRRFMLAAGIMISPEKAVRKALNAMFSCRKQVMPGLLNRLMIPLFPLIPDFVLCRLVKRFGKYFR